MQSANRMRRWVLACAAGATAAIAAPAAAETAAEPPARAVPVVERRCAPVRSCWFDHWGARRCFRRWVCDRDVERDRRARGPARRRYTIEDDYAPESGFDREPSLRRYNGWDRSPEPEVVRPGRRVAPPAAGRDRVDVRPHVRQPPEVAPKPKADTPEPDKLKSDKSDLDKRVAPEAVNRRTPPMPSKAERAPAPKEKSARLKQPPPAAPKMEDPAKAKPAPATAPKQAKKSPEPATADPKPLPVPDDIDKLPRGRKIPMDEIDPPKPKKKLPERLPI